MEDITSSAINKFLARKPGTRSNLSVFATHLRDEFSIDLALPGVGDAPTAARKLAALLKKAVAMGDLAPLTALERILAIAFDLSASTLRNSYRVESLGQRVFLRETSGDYWEVPEPLVQIVRCWQTLVSEHRDGRVANPRRHVGGS